MCRLAYPYTKLHIIWCASFEITDINECTTQPCEQRCANTPGSFECSCDDGYRLENNELTCSGVYIFLYIVVELEAFLCVDINECISSPCEHNCINTVGSYQCTCHSGFALIGTRCIGKCDLRIYTYTLCVYQRWLYFRYQWVQ